MNRRGPILVVVALVLAAYVTYLRAYSGVLSVMGTESTADVVEYRPAGGDSKDWMMRYQFTTGAGTFEGVATFAAKVRPADDVRRVAVKYLPWAPSVSGVLGFISATGLVAYGVAGWTLWRGMRFWRADLQAELPNNFPQPTPPSRRG